MRFLHGGAETPFILLGTKDFAAIFISNVGDRARVLYVVDDFKCHRGELFYGIEIISTDKFLELVRQSPDVVALNCCRVDFSRRFFENLCRFHDVPCLNHEQAIRLLGMNDIIDYRICDWGPSIASRFHDYLAIGQRFADPYSLETLHGVMMFHLTCNPEWHLNIARPYSTLYFRSGLFSLTNKEKFVDCGASVGESTSGLIDVTRGQFTHSWMIEPDRQNIETLRKLQRKYAGTPLESKITLHPVAVGDRVTEVPFHHLGGHAGVVAPNLDATPDRVSVQPVDMIIDDIPTFIKIDIEGFELAALRGSAKAIAGGKPKLALSAYHRPTDLLDLTNYVDSISTGYVLGLRHHTEERWDTCLYFY
ncbi:FkbM family methyltransferase [Paracidovorax valerianellae]|uniref:Methyltransferase, FkbM family n=1 Tax=Paracidovorax valerianellae TaxID=187868 RepID=A0A1G7D623_9BURK|nr:FkbM family methyltransferase [Paracidovorax valerianellae]MDA8447220.1 FkbM family methyltransferase [Paracidovorax valerianellae]SDE47012.1 methyltransferase, FkbM family [Paracidovorax valerianellae]